MPAGRIPPAFSYSKFGRGVTEVSRAGPSERVLELQLERVVRLRVLGVELLERRKGEDRLGAVRELEWLARCGDSIAACEQARAEGAPKILRAPILVQQVEEVENIELEDHVLPPHRRQRLPYRRVHEFRPRRTAGVAGHDSSALRIETVVGG